jgi:hypothetical protein
MALVLADRVRQTGTANTTVSFTLSGSVTGFQSFAVIGNTNTTYYSATDGAGNWEVGIGTYSTTGPTLTRTTILSSSNSGSAVTFSGTVTVFVTYPSSKSVEYEQDGGVVITDAGTNDALRITQTSTGNALLIEDSANPDSTPFVVDATGNVYSGYLTPFDYLSIGGGTLNPRISVAGTTGDLGSIGAAVFANAITAPTVVGAKSRNTTVGSHTVVQSGDSLLNILAEGSDGTAFIRAASIVAAVDGTPGTNDMPGRLVFSTTADGAATPTERMRINSSGNVGVGITSSVDATLYVGKNITGATTAYGILNNGPIQSDVTTTAYMYRSRPHTAAASFTLTNLHHYQASQNTIGAGSAVTNQFGFNVESTLTGATNNYGFYSNIPAGTGDWNFYANGTADNYFAGNVQFAAGTAAAPAITTSGDTNTGIFFPAADTIAFAEGGAEVMRLDSSANLQFNSGYGSVATVYGCRAWVNFNGTASGTFAGGASTVSRTAGSTTATVTTTTAHGLITGNIVRALTGVAVDDYTVTFISATQFSFTTVATTVLSAVSITFAVNSIRASGNVSSITDGGTGIYTVNITNAMPDVNYCVNASASTASISSKIRIMTGYTTTAVTLRTSAGDTSAQSDAADVFVSIFR